MSKQKNKPQLRFKEFEEGWEEKKLGEIAKITTGSTPSTLIEEYYNGNKLFVSPADIQENRFIFKTKTTLTESGFSKGRKVAKGSILFVCIGSTIGKIAQATEECLTNQQINALYANKNYDNNFIYELLEKNGAKIKLLAGVQAVPQINKTDFSNFKYLFPTLPEQQKIASFLSAVDEKIQQLSHKKELLEQYKKGVMQQLFSGKLRFKDKYGDDYPDWKSVKMNELFSFKQGIQCGVEDQFFEKKDNMERFIRIIDLTSDKEIPRFINNIDKENVLFEDDLFMVRYGVPGLIGFGYNGIIANNLFRLIPKKNVHNKFYLYVLTHLKKDIMNLSSSTTMPALNFSSLGVLKIPEIEIEEQQKIANFLSSIDAKIESTTQQLKQTQSFKKGLLQKMFV